MKILNTTEGNGQPPTEAPTDPAGFDHAMAEARPLALEACRRTVAYWRSMTELLAEATRLYNASPSGDTEGRTPDTEEWARWRSVLASLQYDAERAACACVLAAHGRIKRPAEIDKFEPGWGPVALELDGSVLVVHPRDFDMPGPVLVQVDDEDFSSSQDGSGPDWPV